MGSYKYSWILFYLLLIGLVGCLEAYETPAIKEQINILVVDGFINAANNSATVRISRAIALSSNEAFPVEEGATVRIEDISGGVYNLNYIGNGNYSENSITVTPGNKYRLTIQTQDGSEYFSDYIDIIEAPPIDSITWKPNVDGITVSVNTHDPASKTKYYQWFFEETWEYTSKYYSSWKLVNGQPVLRTDNINTCWDSRRSTQILVTSTERLAEDVVHDFSIAVIPKTSGKISRRYSLLLEQRALPKEAYDFWVQLKKTTESLGSLFDPQPSQVLGNIRSASNTSEPILGYFSGGYVTSKRFFIESKELPIDLFFNPNANDRCPLDSIPLRDLASRGNSLLIDAYEPFRVIGYTTSDQNCIDCRLAGGTTTRPDFW